MGVLADLAEKLRAAGLNVYTGPPGKAIEPPAVVLTPGTPDWLSPDSYSTLREAVRAAAVVIPGEDTGAGIWALRSVSQKIWEAAGAAGALWQSASPPAITEIQGVSFLASTHRLTIPLEEEETP